MHVYEPTWEQRIMTKEQIKAELDEQAKLCAVIEAKLDTLLSEPITDATKIAEEMLNCIRLIDEMKTRIKDFAVDDSWASACPVELSQLKKNLIGLIPKISELGMRIASKTDNKSYFKMNVEPF